MGSLVDRSFERCGFDVLELARHCLSQACSLAITLRKPATVSAEICHSNFMGAVKGESSKATRRWLAALRAATAASSAALEVAWIFPENNCRSRSRSSLAMAFSLVRSESKLAVEPASFSAVACS